MGGIIPKSGKYEADKEEEKTELERKNIVVREIDHFLKNPTNRITSSKSVPDLRSKSRFSREGTIIKRQTFAEYRHSEPKAASEEETAHTPVILREKKSVVFSSTPEVSVSSPTPEIIEDSNAAQHAFVKYKEVTVDINWISVNQQLQNVTAELKSARKQVKEYPSEHNAEEINTNLDNCLVKITSITSDNEKVMELKLKILGKIQEYKNQLKEKEQQLSKSTDKIELEDVDATPNKQHFHSVVEFFTKITKELDVIKEEIVDYYGTAVDQDYINIMEKLSAYAKEVNEIDSRGEVRIVLTKEQYEDYIERLQKQLEVIAKDNQNSFLEHKLPTFDKSRNRRKRSRVLDSYAKDLPAEFSGVEAIHEETGQVETFDESQIEVNSKQEEIAIVEEPVPKNQLTRYYERDTTEDQVEVPTSPDDQTGFKVFNFNTQESSDPEDTLKNKIDFMRSNSVVSTEEFRDCDDDAEDSDSAEEIFSDALDDISPVLEPVQEHIYVARGDDNRKRSFNTVRNEYGENLQRLLSEDMDLNEDNYITNENIYIFNSVNDSIENEELLPKFQYSVQEYVEAVENSRPKEDQQIEVVETREHEGDHNFEPEEVREEVEIMMDYKQDTEEEKQKRPKKKISVQIVNETFNTKINSEDEIKIDSLEETNKSIEEDTVKPTNANNEISRESLILGREDVNLYKKETPKVVTQINSAEKPYKETITLESEESQNEATNIIEEYKQEEIVDHLSSKREATVVDVDRVESRLYNTQKEAKEANRKDEETGESQEEIIVLELEEKEEENQEYIDYVKSIISAQKLTPISEEPQLPTETSASSADNVPSVDSDILTNETRLVSVENDLLVEPFASTKSDEGTNNPQEKKAHCDEDEEMDVVPELYSKAKYADVKSSESTEKFHSPVPSDVEEELEEEKRHSLPELNKSFQNKPPKPKPRSLLQLSINQEVLQVEETSTSVATPTDEQFLEDVYEKFVIISKNVDKETQKKLDGVMECLDEIKSCIGEFDGSKQDEIYTGIYDNLIKSMFELNNIKSSNSEVINQKQTMLKIIQTLMANLEEKVA